MWQSGSNVKLRSLEDAKRRRTARLKRAIRVKRVAGELKLASSEGGVSPSREVRIFLNDLSPKGITSVFAPFAMAENQEVTLVLNEPQKIQIEGRVIWCQNTRPDSKIMFQQPYAYRLAIQFTFSSKEDERSLRAFCEGTLRSYLYPPAAQAA